MNSSQNIVLIGMRASGKTSVGRVLAKKMKKKFIDMDDAIEQKERKTITEMVAQKGWEYFRNRETEMCQKLGKEKNLVIATGGGAILRKENMESLKKNGKILLLTAPLRDLCQRVSFSRRTKNQRPSLTGKTVTEELTDLWMERRGQYYACADHVFFVPNRTKNKQRDAKHYAKEIEEYLKGE